jgi:hypothetical protein
MFCLNGQYLYKWIDWANYVSNTCWIHKLSVYVPLSFSCCPSLGWISDAMEILSRMCCKNLVWIRLGYDLLEPIVLLKEQYHSRPAEMGWTDTDRYGLVSWILVRLHTPPWNSILLAA